MFCPPSASLSAFDAVVVPGTKNSVDDLLACREAGLGEALAAFDGPIVGLCGGYQLLGERIENASVEGTDDADTVEGFGLLPVVTRFEGEKVVRPTTLAIEGVGPLAGAAGEVSGYEIHVGRTRAVESVETPFAPADGGPPSGCNDSEAGASLGAATDRVCGTYLHGLFENRLARRAFLDPLRATSGIRGSEDGPETNSPPDGAIADEAPDVPSSPYDRAASLLIHSVDVDLLAGSGSVGRGR